MPTFARRFKNRTRQWDERQIKREQKRFDKGMFRSDDTEGTSIPSGGVADAVNVRSHKDYIEGRPGTLLYTPADIGVTITDNTESLSVLIQTGELYAANSNTIPSAGNIFLVYGEGDTTGDDLATAKGDSVRKYDCFNLSNVSSGTEAIIYVGNIMNPPVTGYGDTSATEFTASKDGTTITASAGTFDVPVVGSYFYWYDEGKTDLIKGYTSSTAIKANASGTITSQSKCRIIQPMNASLYHKSLNKIIALFGNRFYVSKGIPLTGWQEIPVRGNINDRPSSSKITTIWMDGDDAIAINSNGMYKIKMSEESPYFFKMNSPIPTVKVSDVGEATGLRQKYRYTYSLGIITGGVITNDRFDAVPEGVEIIQEAAPCKVDVNRVDYGERWTAEPVGDQSVTYSLITGDALAGTYQNHSGWSSIYNGTFRVPLNSTNYDISVDLTAVESLGDVAYRVQNAVRQFRDLQDIEILFETDHFVVKSGDNDTLALFTTTGTGTDISAALGLDTGATLNASATTTTRQSVGNLTLPTRKEQYTHYCVYRTKNCADEAANENLYTWVADIPVSKSFTASVDGSGNLTITSGKLETEDIGSSLITQGGTTYTISTVTSTTAGTVSPSTLVASTSMAIGGGTVFTASQAGTTLTVGSGKSLTSADVGKCIFWADGKISIIKSVTNTTTAIMISSATHASQGCSVDPVSRTFTDTVSDEDINNGRIAAYPLRNRFQVPMPSGGVGAVVPGYIVTASMGSSRFNYCDVQYKWLAGYYNDGYQKNEEIWDGIQWIVPKDGYVTIRGSVSTYIQNLTTSIDVGAATLGESVKKLTSLKVVSESIGSIGSGGSQNLENNVDLLITNEYAVRTFDGVEYGDNLALKRIQKSDLQKMKQIWITGYNKICGIFVWGKQEV